VREKILRMNKLESILSQSLSLFVLVPLVAFIITLLLQNKQEKIIGKVVRVAKVAYIVLALFFVAGWIINGLQPVSYKLATLYQADHFVFAIYFYYDEITAVFSIVGSLLFFLVATFSKYYMHRDEGYKRFFNIILLFAAGYNFIIFSGNFETLFIGWEIKGLCSFLLIAFYRNRYLPVKNAYKTISNYRISDVALILAMWMMHHLTHQNITYTQLGQARDLAALTHHTDMAIFIVSMFILASLVKSAQFPFTTWLPRAMEGPTSSSAIFYGSLSVHIGVFLLLRTHAFWQDMLWAKIVIIVIGALTGIFATLIARVQPNVKTQIAYSSAAQIGIMFIEIALGFHWLVLIHFAGNAFLRTYQLLVSPSVLNYLVHHQYFHYHPPQNTAVGKFKASLYILAVKEWNLDTIMFKYLWSPFKWIGRQVQFLENRTGKVLIVIITVLALGKAFINPERFELINDYLPIILLSVALLVLLSSFASRKSAKESWDNLIMPHILIISAIVINANHFILTEVLMYGGGVLAAYLLGLFCLQKTHTVDKDISLNKFHGYVYEQKTTALLFLIAAIGFIGFPLTTAFVGIDVFFTYVNSGQVALITLLALCFIFIELAAIRIYLRIYLGPHKKLYHPVAYRSS
jgi:NADH:ubiquinone oxidoreductase subunit 5 (subunit L)/multisubunit Na+/H+ antiporter MnhA subunit